MADKSAHFTRFQAILIPKMMNAAYSITLSGPAGPYTSKTLLITVLSMTIHGKGVYIFDPKQFGVCTNVAVTK